MFLKILMINQLKDDQDYEIDIALILHTKVQM